MYILIRFFLPETYGKYCRSRQDFPGNMFTTRLHPSLILVNGNLRFYVTFFRGRLGGRRL